MTFKTSSKRVAEIEAASKDEKHLTAGITNPGLSDCLGGRGGHATNHPGNVRFRILVSKYKDYYAGLSRFGKLQVAAEVVKLWREQGGRFLAMTDPSKRENSTWYDIGDKEAIKKTSQCLRERIPPHQKARTLEMVSKKAKEIQKRDKTSKCNGKTLDGCNEGKEKSPMSPTLMDRSNISHRPQTSDSDWARPQEQRLLSEDLLPRPIIEAGMVSTASSPHPSPCQASQTSLLTSPPPADHITNSSPVEIPDPTPLQKINSKIQREESLTPSIGSWMSAEDISLMEEFLDGELRDLNTPVQDDDESGAETIGFDFADSSLLPSAANLTKDVFDDSIYAPLIEGKTQLFGWHQAPTSSSFPSPQTTLNQTLSSGFATFSRL